MELNKVLEWRYATKRMNGAKVPQEKVDSILKSVQLAPTSLGLQAFHLFSIENPALRQTIFEKSCQQPQVVEGSHLLVFAARTEVADQDIDAYMELVSKTRGVPVDKLAAFREMVASVQGMDSERLLNWTSRQVYIALGVALVAAAELNVDSTPIEGFSPEVMDEILGLKEKGLHSVVVLALGYRDEANDHLALAAKVRKPLNDIITTLL